MRKILVIAPNWIGDALMAQPLFAQIKARHPRAQIHAIAPKWVAPVLARMPEIARGVRFTRALYAQMRCILEDLATPFAPGPGFTDASKVGVTRMPTGCERRLGLPCR